MLLVPEDPEYGGPGEIVTVLTRIDSQRPYAYLWRADGEINWEILANKNWKHVVNLKLLVGKTYQQWVDAIPELESALNGPWDLNAGRYLELADIYDDAADLIQQGWIQKASARDAQGNNVISTADSAVKFSLDGAMFKLDRKNADHNLMPLVKYLNIPVIKSYTGALVAYDRTISRWNDDANRTQEEVVIALRNTAIILRDAYLHNEAYYIDPRCDDT